MGIIVYLSGEVRVLVQPAAKEGNTLPPEQDFAWTRLTNAPKPTAPVYLGTELTDSITGFKGIAMYAFYMLTGCIGVALQPQGLDKDGSPHKLRQLDEFRVYKTPDNGPEKKPGPIEPSHDISAH